VARVGSLTRLDMRWMLAGRMGEHFDSISTANAGLDRVIDSRRYEETGAFVGGWIYFPTGAVSGFEARVVTFMPGSFIAFSPSSAVSIPSSTTWEWHPKPVARYNDALRAGERKGLMKTWVPARSEVITWIGGNYEYTLSGITMDLLSEVRLVYSTGNWTRLRGQLAGGEWSPWRVEMNEATPMLIFEKGLVSEVPSGSAIRLLGQRRPIAMALDSDTCELSPASWVLEEALAEIHDAYARVRDTGALQPRGDRARANAAIEGLEMMPALPDSVALRPAMR
jgi:hypothetical protein